MTQLAPFKLNDGTTIYIETDDEVAALVTSTPESQSRTPKGMREVAVNSFQIMEQTIKSYTASTLNAFKEVATANVDKVTLEFGVKVAGEGGVPYITKGSGECNLKITVECSFPE